MEKNYLIQLTNNLYRLTLFFPKKEPLRYKMRELADNILAKLARDPISGKLPETPPPAALDDLEALDCFFEVAKAQNWVSLVDALKIQEEYRRIKTEIKKNNEKQLRIPHTTQVVEKLQIEMVKSNSSAEQLLQPLKPSQRNHFSERQEKILAFLRENGRAQVRQIKQILPEVTKRTLRRDFKSLLKQGIIERMGERNDTFYQLKK